MIVLYHKINRASTSNLIIFKKESYGAAHQRGSGADSGDLQAQEMATQHRRSRDGSVDRQDYHRYCYAREQARDRTECFELL